VRFNLRKLELEVILLYNAPKLLIVNNRRLKPIKKETNNASADSNKQVPIAHIINTKLRLNTHKNSYSKRI